jgi:hypothetical protein
MKPGVSPGVALRSPHTRVIPGLTRDDRAFRVGVRLSFCAELGI